GLVREAYRKSGFETGPLGFPTSNEIFIRGGTYQNFQNGAILWSQATGAQVSLSGPIRTAYQSQGFETGILGFPTSGEVAIPGGKYQNFQNGAILWSQATGAQISKNGLVREAYRKSGFETGPLGFPTSNETVVGSDLVQQFQGGQIKMTSSGGTSVSYR
ncbi:LGFP repeat-containing protein, partial [Arthrobacter koreensis]|uniref:LGFP repeat-containing protein n=1 Tax=Arthrobacter koreensis TaxID=199136 RepID=UPI003AC41D77